ncbi:unnamed protein product [Soboliphyme baturini]|uniref:Reverse transcriptase domain-containing protein n=1 Tax=Soboliphyme baturini TaxID=241478 RepID=A0A183IG72_9BILA|nr:unnamed protein product [Soboliphyme baturini]
MAFVDLLDGFRLVKRHAPRLFEASTNTIHDHCEKIFKQPLQLPKT